MSLRERTRPLGIIEPCLPSPAKAPPSGPGWIHEIKHDGFRIMARHDTAGVRLITRHGNDFTDRFPFDENGLAVFDLIRGHGSKASAVLCAFDLLELDGKDLRRRPIEERKGLLAKLLHDRDSDLSIVLNEHYEKDGETVFREDLQARLRGYRVKAARLYLSSWPLTALAESQKSECASGEARG